jgi:hypothetical protein
MAKTKKTGGRTVVAAASSKEPPRKKNMRLHQWKIDAARSVLGTTTETETIETALDLVVFRDELMKGVRAMRGANLVNVFDEE